MIPRLIEDLVISKLEKSGKIILVFWRSYSGAEVDYVEKPMDAPLQAYEFKYGGNTLNKGARSFQDQYRTPAQLINRDNYLQFIGG